MTPDDSVKQLSLMYLKNKLVRLDLTCSCSVILFSHAGLFATLLSRHLAECRSTECRGVKYTLFYSTWGQCYEPFYGRNLRKFVIS
jgi:hypothetical protein